MKLNLASVKFTSFSASFRLLPRKCPENTFSSSVLPPCLLHPNTKKCKFKLIHIPFKVWLVKSSDLSLACATIHMSILRPLQVRAGNWRLRVHYWQCLHTVRNPHHGNQDDGGPQVRPREAAPPTLPQEELKSRTGKSNFRMEMAIFYYSLSQLRSVTSYRTLCTH